MSIEIASQPLNRIRRQDRAVEDEAWIKAMLQRAPYGTLATTLEGQPFIKPVLFFFDEAAHTIYLHGAQEGRTVTNLRANPRVCFNVSEMGRLLPGPSAKECGVEYSSVVVFGKMVITSDEDERNHALQSLLDKYFPHLRPGVDYRPATPEHLNVTNVYRLEIEQWSGKKREAAPNFPGAFRYGDHG